jgi:hypothetical protein
MEPVEFVDFKTIREYIKISDFDVFTTYLSEVFKDLASRNEGSKKKGISKVTFLDYIKLPVFIGEKLFNSLDRDNDSHLNSEEFVQGLCKLYLGDFDQTVGVIFSILDFDKDGIINKDDTKILLSYLPLKTDKTKIEYKFQMDSLEEIDEILALTFSTKNTLKLFDFIKVIEQKKSDVFLQLLCFLYNKKPFNESNLGKVNFGKRKSQTGLEAKYYSPQVTAKRLPSPSRKSILSPIHTFLNINLLNIDNDDSTPTQSGLNGMVRMHNEKLATNIEKEEDVKTIIKKSKNVFQSPSLSFKQSKFPKKAPEFNLEKNLKEMSLEEEDKATTSESDKSKEHEDWIYKLSQSQKVKKYWLVLSGKDIYYYKTEQREEVLGMHNLSGCFVKDNGEKKAGEFKLFSFSVHFSGKTRNYYCVDKKSCLKWIENIKNAIGYMNFFDYYEMLDDIGEGKFGVVKLGVYNKTNDRVAIKIIKKDSLTNTSDIELVKSEIDIMKLCRHPNVVRLLDHFENSEYIFIVMEYLKGGDLGEYFHKVGFKITEKRAASIMYQLASGIKYLHQYGILHRDLKPENIMLTESSDSGIVKVMDFGLSKIIGPQEKVADGFGSLSFVAPEVLVRQPYNKQIDIWSLGVILYYMLTGTLPFDDATDNEELIAKLIVFSEVKFPSKYWSKRSSTVVDLIAKCLIKDPAKRISVDEFINHEWIQKQMI